MQAAPLPSHCAFCCTVEVRRYQAKAPACNCGFSIHTHELELTSRTHDSTSIQEPDFSMFTNTILYLMIDCITRQIPGKDTPTGAATCQAPHNTSNTLLLTNPLTVIGLTVGWLLHESAVLGSSITKVQSNQRKLQNNKHNSTMWVPSGPRAITTGKWTQQWTC